MNFVRILTLNHKTKTLQKKLFSSVHGAMSVGYSDFVWPCKMVSVNISYLFYHPMNEKIKTWTLRFPAKENPNVEKASFDWPIVL